MAACEPLLETSMRFPSTILLMVAVAALCGAATGARATELGNVVSSTPVYASVPVTQLQCVDQPVVYQRPTSGAGALFGAIAGAAIGNGLGGGAGRMAATGIGMVTGAAIGDHVEASGTPPVATTVQQCHNVTRYENRPVGYDVVYEYQGMRHSVRLAQDPGSQIALDVSVAPAGGQPPIQQAQPLPPPVYGARPAALYEPAPAPVVYVPPPVYVRPWPYVFIGASWHGGWYGHGHGHY
jgi:uncharacterized protein YcfJ